MSPTHSSRVLGRIQGINGMRGTGGTLHPSEWCGPFWMGLLFSEGVKAWEISPSPSWEGKHSCGLSRKLEVPVLCLWTCPLLFPDSPHPAYMLDVSASTGLLSLSSADILDWISLHCRTPMHHKMFTGTPGLYPLKASSTTSTS